MSSKRSAIVGHQRHSRSPVSDTFYLFIKVQIVIDLAMRSQITDMNYIEIQILNWRSQAQNFVISDVLWKRLSRW